MLNSAHDQRPNLQYWLPLHLRVRLPQITILISHDQLPSGLEAQLVEQW